MKQKSLPKNIFEEEMAHGMPFLAPHYHCIPVHLRLEFPESHFPKKNCPAVLFCELNNMTVLALTWCQTSHDTVSNEKLFVPTEHENALRGLIKSQSKRHFTYLKMDLDQSEGEAT